MARVRDGLVVNWIGDSLDSLVQNVYVEVMDSLVQDMSEFVG